MKKLLLLSILLSGAAYSQEYEFNIPMVNKPHKVIKFSSELGKTYNWDRCFGQTTQTLSEDGVSCEKVINSRSGFTGSVDVCVTATKDYLSDPYCFAMCGSENITWGNCTASVTLSEHLETKSIINSNNDYVGNANLICNDGHWSIQSSECNDKTAICDNSIFQGCSLGTASAYKSAINDTTATWNCVNGSSTVSCSKEKTSINASCGYPVSVLETPPTNHCATGTVENYIDYPNGGYAWTCKGSINSDTTYEGNTVSCNADKPPVCGTNYRQCAKGTASAYTSAVGAVDVTWNCTVLNVSKECSKPATVGTSGTCGTANGSITSTSPTANLCATGTQTTVIDNGTNYTWSCNGQSGTLTRTAGANANCSAIKEIIASCGSDNGLLFVSPQTPSNLCSSGVSEDLRNDANSFYWTCQGTNNSINCSANREFNCNFTNGSPVIGKCSSGIYSGKRGVTNVTGTCSPDVYSQITYKIGVSQTTYNATCSSL